MKKTLKIITIVAMFVVSISVFVGCASGDGDKKLFKELSEFTFWKNKTSEAMPQTVVHDIVNDHLEAALPEGKTEKKVAILGFDGARADSLANIIISGYKVDENTDYSGIQMTDKRFSGVNAIKNEGGVYFTFAGGEKGKVYQQHTSTAPGWASILTGTWGEKNGITNNGMYKNIENKTILLKAAKGDFGKNYRTAFAASWNEHFEKSYLSEIEYVKENAMDTMRFFNMKDSTVDNENYDERLHSYLLDAVTVGHADERDIVFGIYEAPDYNGHDTMFTNKNHKYANAVSSTDTLCYEVIDQIKNRSTYDSEDWLIILTSDHGGTNTWHGNQTVAERSTFLVANKVIDTKYYGKNYNGLKYNNK